ncbi:MAG: hypothetical protein JNK52_12405, partial [Zoogloeaceae bacterium]|nr:hypothetical protein [Zoogloeaceae bacterium]
AQDRESGQGRNRRGRGEKRGNKPEEALETIAASTLAPLAAVTSPETLAEPAAALEAVQSDAEPGAETETTPKRRRRGRGRRGGRGDDAQGVNGEQQALDAETGEGIEDSADAAPQGATATAKAADAPAQESAPLPVALGKSVDVTPEAAEAPLPVMIASAEPLAVTEVDASTQPESAVETTALVATEVAAAIEPAVVSEPALSAEPVTEQQTEVEARAQPALGEQPPVLALEPEEAVKAENLAETEETLPTSTETVFAPNAAEGSAELLHPTIPEPAAVPEQAQPVELAAQAVAEQAQIEPEPIDEPPLVEVAVETQAPVATKAEPLDLGRVAAESGLILIETDRNKVASETPAESETPRLGRRRKAAPVIVSEPLQQVETANHQTPPSL